jgi:hypothetical protein
MCSFGAMKWCPGGSIIWSKAAHVQDLTSEHFANWRKVGPRALLQSRDIVRHHGALAFVHVASMQVFSKGRLRRRAHYSVKSCPWAGFDKRVRKFRS